jgi:methionyl-tRNA synthetase
MCALKVAGVFLTPIMPHKMQQLLAALGVSLQPEEDNLQLLSDNLLASTFTITPLTEVLFARPVEADAPEKPAAPVTTKPEITAMPETNFADITDLAKIQLSIGKIIAAEKLAGSDKLLKLQVDFGVHGTRQVVSGIAQHYQPEQIIGQSAVFVINLKPRKIMGLESQAMILCASNDDKSALSFLTPQQAILPGANIS